MPSDEKWRMFVFTLLQIVMSLVITVVASIICFAAYVMTRISFLASGSPYVAEFAVVLLFALAGGLISKCDYTYHTSSEELLQHGDYHENLRHLYHANWLNVVHDLFGLLPAVSVFIFANAIIWQRWHFVVSGQWIVALNAMLFIGAVALIPFSCSFAHKEVAKQASLFDEKNSKHNSVH